VDRGWKRAVLLERWFLISSEEAGAAWFYIDLKKVFSRHHESFLGGEIKK
jgi:hypothetical protein